MRMRVQLSAAFFRHFVVEIDFNESIIQLIPKEKFEYAGNGQAIQMKAGPFDSRTVNVDLIMQDGNRTSMKPEVLSWQVCESIPVL